MILISSMIICITSSTSVCGDPGAQPEVYVVSGPRMFAGRLEGALPGAITPLGSVGGRGCLVIDQATGPARRLAPRPGHWAGPQACRVWSGLCRQPER